MPSQPADTTLTRRTRPSNATSHPGAILLQAKKTRRTAEEVAAAQAEKAAQATAAEAGAKRIAGVELEMEAKQTTTLARKAKGVRPRPIPTKGKKVALEDGLSQADVTAAYGEGDEMGLKDDQGLHSERTVKKKNQSFDEGSCQSNKDVRVHKKGDSMDVIMNKPEYTLGNKVDSWVSGIKPIKNRNALSSHVTLFASPPPSTIFSRLTGSSKTTHSEIPTSILNGPQCSGVDEDIPGGFADDEDEDEVDELERQAAHGITAKEGRSAAAMALTLTIYNSDDELEIPAEFRAPFTQPSPVSLPKASFAVGNLKRKASEGSEIEDFLSVDAFDNTMEIDQVLDKSDLMYEAKPGKPPTSVVTTDVKPALTKKAKLESLKVSTSLPATSAKPKEHSVNVDTPHDNLKPRVQYRNTNLPEQVQTDHHWAKKFLPTMMLWASSQESLWSIPDETLLTHIQIAFQAVYPELNLTVQQLSEWWSNFGSMAITIIFNFLTSNNDCDPEVLAGLLLKNFTFIFKDMDKCKPDGAFHSAFMLQLLGKAHLSAINGHATIPILKTKDLVTKGMAGVIAFCATALECAVTLISDGDIKVEDILASTSARSKLNIKLPKVLNKVTGKVMSTPYLFSRDLWGKANTGYMKGIKKKGLDFVETTVDMSYSLAPAVSVHWPSDTILNLLSGLLLPPLVIHPVLCCFLPVQNTPLYIMSGLSYY
ncbi:hypothetical protein F4604DRAFT_1995983 [Suillus subluteus]|nr:hypothetical protein F4604DRAFT_1995983 [Suillus subluteus]